MTSASVYAQSVLALKALEQAGRLMRCAPRGMREQVLREQSRIMGRHVATGAIPRGKAERGLLDAALEAGLSHAQAAPLMAGGLDDIHGIPENGAVNWLKQALTGMDWADGKTLKAMAKQSGVAERTLYRAARKLGVKMLSGGFSKPRRWHLCQPAPHVCHVCQAADVRSPLMNLPTL